MTDELMQEIKSFLEMVANTDNWQREEDYGPYGYSGYVSIWNNSDYDPRCVAEELLAKLSSEAK